MVRPALLVNVLVLGCLPTPIEGTSNGGTASTDESASTADPAVTTASSGMHSTGATPPEASTTESESSSSMTPSATSDSSATSTTAGDSGTSGTTGAGGPRRAFLTSEVFGAQLGGIEGADEKCQLAADSAGLGGTFRAWISTPESSAFDNLVHSSEPYVRVDGVQIALDWSDLIDGDLAAPLEVDEWGAVQNNGDCGNVWTNTIRDGKSHEDACTGWTALQDSASLGRSDMSNHSWTEGCIQDCLKQYHLYCFEQ